MRMRRPRSGSAWFAARLRTALALRERLFDEPFYRLVHAEADGLPGVVIDRFGDAAVVQPNAAWAEVRLDALVEALVAVTGVSTVVKNAGGRARSLEGLDDVTRVLRGEVTGPVPVPDERGHVSGGPDGRAEDGALLRPAAEPCLCGVAWRKGARVLDVFAHVGGFALAALAAGAERALAVDSSSPALELAAEGARATGVAERFATEKGDAFAVMEALRGDGGAVRAGRLRSAGLRAVETGAGGGLARL